MEIPSRTLKTGYEMPQLGLGTWPLHGRECVEAVTAALDMGYRHIDTADMYGNQREVGEALAKFDRDSIFVTSKVPPGNLRYEDVIATCERDLEELGLSFLDLYLIHWPNATIPLEETLRGLAEVTDRGWVRSIGVSNFIIERLERALEISEAPVCVNQVEFHPMLYQKELLAYCDENGVALTAYCPLARTRAFDLPEIQAAAEKHEVTPAQVCLRWLVQKGIIVIPKSKSSQRIRENMQIFDWWLDEEDVAKIDGVEKHLRIRDEARGDFSD